jgi:carbonic anhydrase
MKRTFLFTSLFALSLALPVLADDHGHAAGVSPEDSLKRLTEGNARFVAGNAAHPRGKTDIAHETAVHGQHPFATILSCSDSRVPLQIVFDQGIGDIFGINIAGNVVGKPQLGSIEYGVAHTGTKLVVVLGHTNCGAVTAACTGGGHEGNIEVLMRALAPAVKKAEENTGKKGKEIIPETVKANVFIQIAALLRGSGILREAVMKKEIQIIGAVYDIDTGKVEFLGQHPRIEAMLKDKKDEKKPEPKVEKPPVTKKETEKVQTEGTPAYGREPSLLQILRRQKAARRSGR